MSYPPPVVERESSLSPRLMPYETGSSPLHEPTPLSYYLTPQFYTVILPACLTNWHAPLKQPSAYARRVQGFPVAFTRNARPMGRFRLAKTQPSLLVL